MALSNPSSITAFSAFAARSRASFLASISSGSNPERTWSTTPPVPSGRPIPIFRSPFPEDLFDLLKKGGMAGLLPESPVEGRAAVEASRKYDRIVQIGTQQHSWPHYLEAAEVIHSGRLGEISEVKVWDYDYYYPGMGSPPDGDPPEELDWDFWLGPSPKVPYNPNRYRYHYWFFDYGGAWQLDWAVHHYDMVHFCLGVSAPKSAVAMGGFLCFEETNTEWPDTFSGIWTLMPFTGVQVEARQDEAVSAPRRLELIGSTR